MSDLQVSGGGSVYLLRPVSDKGKAWIDENLQVEDWQWFGGAVAVDHHFITSLADMATYDGLEVTA